MPSLAKLRAEASRVGVVVPSQQTLDKYGLTEREWLWMLSQTHWACPICDRRTKTGRYVTDHEHVRGWVNMPPEERKLYVRGVTCWTCNRYLLARDISVDTAQRVVGYLERYQDRRP